MTRAAEEDPLPDRTIDLPDASAPKGGMFDGASGAADANLERPGDQIGHSELNPQLGEGGGQTHPVR